MGLVVIKAEDQRRINIIGKVKGIELQTNRTKLVLSINSNVKIPQQSKCAIKEKGLLGDVYLNIMRSPDNQKYLSDGDLIEEDQNQMNLSMLIEMAGYIGKDIKNITRKISSFLGDDSLQKSGVSVMLSDLKSILFEKKNYDNIYHLNYQFK